MLIKEICRDATTAGNFNTRSLHANGASIVIQAGCSKKLIQQPTGQRSFET